MKSRSVAPTEAQEQAALFEWAKRMEGKYPALRWMHAIPNGGSRNLIEARHLKEQGVKAGVADIFLPSPNAFWCGLYIEMKRREGGKLSKEQEAFLVDMTRAGYCAAVCRGWDEARQIIEKYLGGRI